MMLLDLRYYAPVGISGRVHIAVGGDAVALSLCKKVPLSLDPRGSGARGQPWSLVSESWAKDNSEICEECSAELEKRRAALRQKRKVWVTVEMDASPEGLVDVDDPRGGRWMEVLAQEMRQKHSAYSVEIHDELGHYFKLDNTGEEGTVGA